MTSFSSAWLRGDDKATALLPARFRDATARREAVQRARERVIDPAVLDVLRAQNAALSAEGLAPSAARDRNVAALGDAGTVCVVTGQQVGLFLGPLYTVYKAASAVACARALERETGARCVPVFWLQTEDHDVAEIDHVVIPRGAGDLLTLRVTHASERVPVAHLALGPSVVDACAALRAELGAHPHAGLLDVIERAYVPDATFGAAFARVLAHVFRDDGLVFLDPRDARLAPRAAPIHARALEDAAAIASALEERVRALASSGYDAQVHVRPGAPLSFYAPDAVEGARYRLDPTGPAGARAWAVVGRPAEAWSTGALLDALAKEPARFSTSALLRPILQDTWLPTAAYVGGPAEMAYFAQLAPLYERFGLDMPLPVPRARVRVVDDRARALLDKLGLAPDDLEGPRAQPKDALLARIAARARPASEEGAAPEAPEEIEARLRAAVDAALDRVAPAFAALDPSLAKATARTKEAMHDAAQKLVAKYGRALAQRDQVTVERLERLLSFLVPDGAPQERVHGLPYYACRFGDAFTASVVDAVERAGPFTAAHVELRP